MLDLRFKLVVAAVVGALALGIVYLRFCGELDLPAKPPPPTEQALGKAGEIITESASTPAAWHVFLEKDAGAAGLPTPTPDVMSRALVGKVDTTQRTLAPDTPPLDVAGLRLSLEVMTTDERTLVLVVENLGERALAYQVLTSPSVNPAACHGREILPYNAHVVGPRERERRSECVYRDGMTIDIRRVETLELEPLMAYYLSRVPPGALTTDARLARGHKPRGGGGICNVMMSQAIRGGVESGRIEWRDLVDFYARHRCDTYQFPQGYKAFNRDGERSLPAVRTIP